VIANGLGIEHLTHDLLICVTVRLDMDASPDAPPYDHSSVAGENALARGDRNYGMFIPGDDDWNARMNDAETTTLAMILSGGLKEFGYVYDFGDLGHHPTPSFLPRRLCRPP
jgi:hypothetical protein